jgi:hypothetical protein
VVVPFKELPSPRKIAINSGAAGRQAQQVESGVHGEQSGETPGANAAG